MTRYALLIRGVNLGAANSLPMAELRCMLEQSGCSAVRTYLQSGNAVFSSDGDVPALRAEIERRLADYMHRPIATTLRSGPELAAVVAANPFGPDVARDPRRLAVTFLSAALTPAARDELERGDFGDERFRIGRREIYSWHPAGLGRSRLAQVLIALPGPGTRTMRNWNTVLGLVALLDAGDSAPA